MRSYTASAASRRGLAASSLGVEPHINGVARRRGENVAKAQTDSFDSCQLLARETRSAQQIQNRPSSGRGPVSGLIRSASARRLPIVRLHVADHVGGVCVSFLSVVVSWRQEG